LNPTRFISCDWGTSNLRLRLFDGAQERVVAEVSSNEGVRHAFERAAVRGSARERTYIEILARAVERLQQRVGVSLDHTDLIISGMASSSLGIEELPYARLPFSLTGRDLVQRGLQIRLPRGQRIVLVSGVRSDTDVMRGEETQLIGLHQRLAALEGAVLYILPGTHSKHALVENGALVDFHTFLTGELFEAVIGHTVLHQSVITPEAGFAEGPFREGVLAAADGLLLNALFRGRTNTLFGRFDRAENHSFVSGAVIGAELSPLAAHRTERIRLCAGSALRPLYESAAAALGIMEGVESVPAGVVEESVAWGQLALLQRLQESRD
jgi:2-dehydro-3-deoxygalactonokinase